MIYILLFFLIYIIKLLHEKNGYILKEYIFFLNMINLLNFIIIILKIIDKFWLDDNMIIKLILDIVKYKKRENY